MWVTVGVAVYVVVCVTMYVTMCVAQVRSRGLDCCGAAHADATQRTTLLPGLTDGSEASGALGLGFALGSALEDLGLASGSASELGLGFDGRQRGHRVLGIHRQACA